MRKPNVSYFRVFGCKCFVLNTKDNLGKFDTAFEAIFVGYSNTSKAYRIFNKFTLTIEEPMQVKFEESNAFVKNVVQIDSLGEDMEKVTLKDSPTQSQNVISKVKFKRLKWNHKNHFRKIEDTLQVIPRNSS